MQQYIYSIFILTIIDNNVTLLLLLLLCYKINNDIKYN